MTALANDLVETSRLITSTYPPDLPFETFVDRRSVRKLTEEVGELAQAVNGLVGENPRKGVTHTMDDVLAELLDVAACALGAYEAFTGYQGMALPALASQTAAKLTRLRSAVDAGQDERILRLAEQGALR